MGKRAWQYPEATGITNDDVILLDSPTGGSRSIKANKIGSVLINKTLTERGTFDATDDNVDGYKKVTVDVPYTDVEVASGPVASWDDGEDLPLKSLTSFIEPQQEGSGDPSPENVRPISGWDEVNVTNDAVYGGTVAWNQLVSNEAKSASGTSTSAQSYRTLWSISPMPDHVMYMSANLSTATQGAEMYIQIGWSIKTSLNGGEQLIAKRASKEPASIVGIRSTSSKELGSFDYAWDNLMLIDLTQMFGSTIADYIYSLERATAGSGVAYFKSLFYKDYYPYNSGEITNVSAVNGDTDKYHTYTIDLDGTRYGGTLDVVSGVLTVDRAYVDLGTLTWNYSSPMFYASLDNAKMNDVHVKGNELCSHYKTVAFIQSQTFPDKSVCIIFWKTRGVNIKDSSYTDATAFKTAMNGVQLVYELATPQTYQLTPTQVKSLLGTNNVWADTGDVDVEYQKIWVRPSA